MTTQDIPPTNYLPVPSRLTELEQVIEQGLSTFVSVAHALNEIRESKLYPQDSFDAYCKERWGFTQGRASHLIVAGDVYKDISHIVEPHDTNEGQMRELAKIPREERELIYTLAYEATGGKPTASNIRSLGVALNEVMQTGYITVDDQGTQKLVSKMSPDERKAHLSAYLERETYERFQQHIAGRKSLTNALESGMVTKISLPKEQVSELRTLAKHAPETDKDAYRKRWRDSL
jgi:hypothetical protein